MKYCTQCGAAARDDASFCPNCGYPFYRQSQQKKKRSFLASLLSLLGIGSVSQAAARGSGKGVAIIAGSVAAVAIIITGVIVGPILKAIPPFAPNLTVIGTVVPGGSVIVHGSNFPSGSRINLTLDGAKIAQTPYSRHAISQSLNDIGLSAVQDELSSANIITVRHDGTFDVHISIPQNWQPNSQHIIQAQAIGQDGSVQTQVQQTVTIPPSLAGVTSTQGTRNTSPITSGSPGATPTSSQGASQCANSSTGTGTNLTFTFPGAAPCLMSVVKIVYCRIFSAYGSFEFEVVGIVNGTQYSFLFGTTTTYHGPGTYMINALIAKNTDQDWRTNAGNVIFNGDGKSGSANALMYADQNTSGTVAVMGTWACS